MRNMYSMFYAALTAMILSTTPVLAEDGYFYGFRGAEGKEAMEFLRYEIATGTWEVLNSDVKALGNVETGSGVLDALRGEYQVMSGSFELLRLDINSGEVLSSVPMGNLPGSRWYTSAYDHTTDLVYGIEAGSPPMLTGTDNTGKIVSQIEIQSPGFNVRLCEVFFDSPRGYYIVRTEEGAIIAIDIHTGIMVNRVEVGPAVEFTAYSEKRGKIYGITSMNEGQAALAEIDPITGIREDRPIPGMDLAKLSVGLCSNGFHDASNTYCFMTMFGVWQINVLTAQAELMPLISGRRPVEMEVHNRVKEIHPVNGSVYADMNENCGDDNEPTVGRFPLLIEPAGYRVFSNQNGQIRINLPEGQFTADPQVKWPWRMACNDFGHRLSVNENGLTNGNLDFGLYPEALVKHLQLSIGSDQPLLGRQVHYRILAFNSGTVPFNGRIRFVHDVLLTDFSATPAADDYAGATAEWEVKNLAIGAYFFIDVLLNVPTDESLRGTEMCASVDLVNTDGPDLLATERRDISCAQIRGSYDPNDMSVYPRGFGERGLVTRDDSTLAYTVRFQNIGDAPAFDVVIRDTLSSRLDGRTLRFGTSSHDYSVNLLDDTFLEFTFSDINLPGKNTDEAGSQGFVKYYIDLYKYLPVDTEIRNSAAIYFDSNEPVITNTVLNTITESVTDVVDHAISDELELRSLGNGLFVCHADGGLEGRLSVFSVLGTKVFEQSLTGQSQAVVNLSSQPTGRYLIRLASDDRAFVRSVTVVR